MCLAVIALDAHPRFHTVIAANRDEFHARPAAAAHWWRDGQGARILAGRDLEAGGTWLGLSERGRWAFVTNVREPGRHDPRAPSRGALVPGLLADPRELAAALAAALARSAAFNGFNVVVGDGASAAFGSNRGAGAVVLDAGIHGVSNAALDTPWPKLERAKAGLARWLTADERDPRALWEVLADRALAADDELPSTGITLELERRLSAPFIVGESYGTRCSTVIALGRDGKAHFAERSFDAAGHTTGEVEYRFELGSLASADLRVHTA